MTEDAELQSEQILFRMLAMIESVGPQQASLLFDHALAKLYRQHPSDHPDHIDQEAVAVSRDALRDMMVEAW